MAAMSFFSNQDWSLRQASDETDTDGGGPTVNRNYAAHQPHFNNSSDFTLASLHQRTQAASQEPLFARRGVQASISKQLGLTLAGAKSDLFRESGNPSSPSLVGVEHNSQSQANARTPSVLLSAPTTPSLHFDGGRPPSSSSSSSFAMAIPPSFTSTNATSTIPLVRSRSTSSSSVAHRKKVLSKPPSSKSSATKGDSRRPSVTSLYAKAYDVSSVAQPLSSPFAFNFSQSQSQQSTPNLTGEGASFNSTTSYFPTSSSNAHSNGSIVDLTSSGHQNTFAMAKGQMSSVSRNNFPPALLNASNMSTFNQNNVLVVDPRASSGHSTTHSLTGPHDPMINLLSMTNGSGNGLVSNGVVGELMISKSLSSVAESAAKMAGPFIASTSVAVAASAAVAVNKRVSAACNFCKVRKLRCDGHSPCQQCSRRSLSCVFSKEAEIRKRRKRAATVSEGTVAKYGKEPMGGERESNGKRMADANGARMIIHPLAATQDTPLLSIPPVPFAQQPIASSLFSFTDPTSALALSSQDFAAASALRPQQLPLMHNAASAWPDQSLSDWALEELGLNVIKPEGSETRMGALLPPSMMAAEATMLPFAPSASSTISQQQNGLPQEHQFHFSSADQRTSL